MELYRGEPRHLTGVIYDLRSVVAGSGWEAVLEAVASLADDGSGSVLVLDDEQMGGLEKLRLAAESRGLAVLLDVRIEGTAGLDLAAVEWGATSFREFIASFEDSLGPDEGPRYSVSGADNDWAAGSARRWKARLLTLLQLTLRGMPVVSGGMGDPAQVWLEGEERDPESDLNFVRHLVSLRRHCPALTVGDYHVLQCEQQDVFGFVRETELQRLTVLLNFSPQSTVVQASGPVGGFVAGTQLVEGDGLSPEDGRIGLEGFEGRVYELRRTWA